MPLPDVPLRTHLFEHGGFRAELIAPESPDALIDVSDFNRDERLPYWAELWPSARALAAELLDGPLPQGRVLELGCGIALPSLALRWRGAEVVASDYYADALDFAVENARRNQIDPPATLLLDWREPPADLRPFDLVIAADVLYEHRNVAALAGVLPAVTAPGGRVLLADPGRTYLQPFREEMERRGWRVAEVGRRAVPGPASGHPLTIRILSLRPGI